MRDQTIQLHPIGVVRSDRTRDVDRGWGTIEARIVLDEPYRRGIVGLEAFSHVLVVSFLHRARFDPDVHLVRRPRDRADMPEIGIFAQRARHRPNPLGVTAVRLSGVEPDGIRVVGLDAIDGTPVLDIKPYFPIYDRVPDPVTSEWVDRLMEGYF